MNTYRDDERKVESKVDREKIRGNVILIIAYHFPPENAIGGVRPYRFYRHLSELGCRCHVITAARQTPGTRNPDVEYVPDPCSTGKHAWEWQVERALRKFLLVGTRGILWSRLAARAAKRFVETSPGAVVIVFSTCPPVGAHLAGWLIARSLRAPWIADYRDAMGSLEHNKSFQMRSLATRWLDRWFKQNADLVIANTDTMAETFINECPSISTRTHVIWNGFDPGEEIGPLAIPEARYRVYSHVGELYGGRNISLLIESISRLIDSGHVLPSEIRVRFVGPTAADCLPAADVIKRAKSLGWLEICPHLIPQDEARHLIRTSNGLLLVQPQSALQVPGKIFDYIRTGRPILAFIPRNSPTERVLGWSGVPHRCVYNDSPAHDFDSAVLEFLSLRSEPIQARQWYRDRFNCLAQTDTLAELIARLVDARTHQCQTSALRWVPFHPSGDHR